MLKTTTYTSKGKHIVWVCVVLFALTPCIVKEAFFGLVNIDYAKPLNQSKTTSHTNTCQYAQNEIRQISASKQTKESKQLAAVSFFTHQYFVVRSAKINNKYSKTFSGNSPPKYILYKRLKLHIA